MISITLPVADGNSSAVAYRGGASMIACYGADFDSGTATLYFSPDAGTTWIAATDRFGAAIAFSANGAQYFIGPDQILLRATVSGSSGATDAVLEIWAVDARARLREAW